MQNGKVNALNTNMNFEKSCYGIWNENECDQEKKCSWCKSD